MDSRSDFQDSWEVPNSNLTFVIVLDLEKIITSADIKTEGLSYTVGNFFDPSTITSADLILYPWSDEESIEILKNARNAFSHLPIPASSFLTMSF
jgi:hypothetical protein